MADGFTQRVLPPVTSGLMQADQPSVAHALQKRVAVSKQPVSESTLPPARSCTDCTTLDQLDQVLQQSISESVPVDEGWTPDLRTLRRTASTTPVVRHSGASLAAAALGRKK